MIDRNLTVGDMTQWGILNWINEQTHEVGFLYNEHRPATVTVLESCIKVVFVVKRCQGIELFEGNAYLPSEKGYMKGNKWVLRPEEAEPFRYEHDAINAISIVAKLKENEGRMFQVERLFLSKI